MWRPAYRRLRRLSSSDEVETWLLQGIQDGAPGVGKFCGAPHSPGWTRLLAVAQIMEKLEPLRWVPGAPYGVAGVCQSLATSQELCLIFDFIPGQEWTAGQPGEAVSVVAALARLLSHVHTLGVIHGDLKPSNVILTPPGAPVLLDFGYWAGGPLDASVTPRYVSPELSGEVEAPVGPASDLYSLGVILQERLEEGELPRYGAVLQRLLQPNPEQRYQDGQALALDLESLARGENPVIAPGQAAPITAFAGRTREMERLLGVRQLAVQGQGGWVGLAGSSGMGKTRLLKEFAACSGFRVLWGGCSEGGLQPGYGLLREAFESLSAAELTGPLPPLPARLLATVFPRLSQVLGVRGEAPTTLGVLHQEQLTEALSLLFQALGSKERPVLWVFDDLQWADPETCSLLLRLSQRSQGYFLVCLLYRPADWSPPCIHYNLELQLGPLAEEEVRQLAAWVHPQADPQWVQAGAQWSQGSPFFLWEFLRQGPQQATQVSDRAMLYLRQRFSSLAPEAQRVLSVCALVGRDFPLPLLRSLFPASQLEPALQEAVAQRMVRLAPEAGHFVHDQLRESALALLQESQRQQWHRRIADQLDDPGQKGHHLYHAGDLVAARPYCLEAARAARLSLALPRARILYQMGLQGHDDLEVRIELHLVQKALGLKEEAMRTLEEALQDSLPDETAARIHGLLAQVVHEWIEPAKTIAHAQEALRRLGMPVPRPVPWLILRELWLAGWRLLAPPPIPEWKVALHLETSHCLLWADLYSRDETVGLYVLRASSLAWAHRGQPEAIVWLAGLACVCEHFELSTLARFLEKEVRRRLSALQDPLALAMATGPLTCRGLAEREQRAYYHTLVEDSQIAELDNFYGFTTAQMVLGWFRLGAGRLTELARESHRMIRWADNFDHGQARANALYGLLLADPGRVTAAQIEKVFASYTGRDNLLDVVVAICMAIVSLRDGSFERPLLRLASLKPKLPRLQVMVAVWQASVARTAAEALPRSAARRREQLLAQAEQALARGLKRSPMMRLYHCHALRERALLRLARGRPEQARRAFQEALQEALDCSMPYQEALTRLEWARAGRLLDWPETLEHEQAAIARAREMEAGWLLPQQARLPAMEELAGTAERLLRAESPQRGQLLERGLHLSHQTLADQMPGWSEFWTALAGAAEERSRLENLVAEAERATRRRWSRPPCAPLHGHGARAEQARLVYQQVCAQRQQQLQVLNNPHLPPILLRELESLWADPSLASLDEILGPLVRRGLALTRPPKEPPMERLDGAARTALRALVRESCNNILKYVTPPRAVLTYRLGRDHLVVSVSDQGPGLDRSRSGGFGLRALPWRARLAGGSFTVATAPGGGTLLTMTLPLLAAR